MTGDMLHPHIYKIKWLPTANHSMFSPKSWQLCVVFKAPGFVHAQLGVPREGGLRRQDIGRTRHPHQEPPRQVRRPRLLSHPEEHRAEDADAGHLAAAGGSNPHRQPQTLADLQIKAEK